MKTFVATPSTRERNWLLVDADGQTLGRLATQIADALRGNVLELEQHREAGGGVCAVVDDQDLHCCLSGSLGRALA